MSRELQAATSKHALHSFPLEWFIGLLCAFFIASKCPNTSHSAWQNQLTANLHHPLHPDLHSLYNGAASYSVTCSLPPTKEMNLKSNTKWNSRDLQNNLLIISYTIVPPVSYLFAHRRSYHLFFHISIFKCNYLFHTPVFHNPGIPEYTFPLPHALKL
jgi:hypothetical protein